MITGNDEVSLQILESLDEGTKVKDIPALFPVSLDQAKRLSRFNRMVKNAEKHVAPLNIETFRELGLKGLYLAPLFKAEDWDGLSEILTLIDVNTKRDDLPLLIQSLAAKRKRVSGFEKEVHSKLQSLEKKELELQKTIEETQKIQDEVGKQLTYLKKYKQQTRTFLIKHLGSYEGELVLSKRLDSLWQTTLKKQGILRYDDLNYLWIVVDLDRLVEEYEKRIHRKDPHRTEWELEVEYKRFETNRFTTGFPSQPYYQLPNHMGVDFTETLKETEKRIIELKKEQTQIQLELKHLKKETPKSFMESVNVSNTFSVHDLKKHGQLVDKALKWLYNLSYVVASEVTLPNGKRADVIGYNENGEIMIIEVKVSLSDFRGDDKWTTYLDYCDQFYFLLDTEPKWEFYNRDDCEGMGLLCETKTSIDVEVSPFITHTATDREKVIFAINRALAKKYVYGF